MTLEERITEEVRGLETMSLEGLRGEWRRRRYGAPPTLRSVELLRRLLAWRIQSDALGGLDAAACKAIRSEKKPSRDKLPRGAKFIRQWHGVTHEVQVGEGRFFYMGREYRSLSEIAREITGVRWNGPRFFGLRTGEQG